MIKLHDKIVNLFSLLKELSVYYKKYSTLDGMIYYNAIGNHKFFLKEIKYENKFKYYASYSNGGKKFRVKYKDIVIYINGTWEDFEFIHTQEEMLKSLEAEVLHNIKFFDKVLLNIESKKIKEIQNKKEEEHKILEKVFIKSGK
jgi:hypothetical protein